MASNYTEIITYSDISGTRVIPFTGNIKYFDHMVAPIYSMIRAMSTIVGSPDAMLKWPEGQHKGLSTTINNTGGYNASDTSIVVVDDTIFIAGDTATVITTGELMKITAIDRATHALTVTRGIGNSGTGLVMADAVDVVHSGNAEESAGEVGDSSVAGVDDKYNYIQHFTNPWDVSDYYKNSNITAISGMKVDEIISKQGAEHVRQFETSLILGKRDAVTIGTKKTYFAGGLKEAITTNVQDYNVSGSPTSITKATFDAWVSNAMNKGSSEKYLHCGNNVINMLSVFTDAFVQQTKQAEITASDGTVLGMRPVLYRHSAGDIYIVANPILNDLKMPDYCFMLDMSELNVGTWVNEDAGTNLLVNLQNPNQFKKLGAWSSYFTWMIQHEQTHGYAYGIAGGSTS